MFKHILIPTDGSDLSRKAVLYGVQLAKECGARVTALTLTEPYRVADEIGALGLAPDEAGQPRRVRRLEPALARRHAKCGERLDRHGEALDGVPAEVLQPGG